MYLTSTSCSTTCMRGCKAFMKRRVTSGCTMFSGLPAFKLHWKSSTWVKPLSRLQCISIMRIMSRPLFMGVSKALFCSSKLQYLVWLCCLIGHRCPFHGLAVVKEASSIGKAVQWRPEICETNPYALPGNPIISRYANGCSNWTLRESWSGSGM